MQDKQKTLEQVLQSLKDTVLTFVNLKLEYISRYKIMNQIIFTDEVIAFDNSTRFLNWFSLFILADPNCVCNTCWGGLKCIANINIKRGLLVSIMVTKIVNSYLDKCDNSRANICMIYAELWNMSFDYLQILEEMW